jgi:hypothetical protein
MHRGASTFTLAVDSGDMSDSICPDMELGYIRADGRYALRRLEVNVERAEEWRRDAEAAASAGRPDQAAAAVLRHCAFSPMAGALYPDPTGYTVVGAGSVSVSGSNSPVAFSAAGVR